MVVIQCHGESRAIQCRYIISIYDYLLFMCVHALICICMCVHALTCICSTFFIFSPILLSVNCHSDYDTIEGRIAGNGYSYHDIFQRFIKSPRVHELCQTHFVVET